MLELREQIDEYLEHLVFSCEPLTARFVEAMRYSLIAGGRRIGPMLALATADACGHPPASVLPLAAAVEMIHTCSLIHDDLPALDNEDLRRGRPSAHLAHGEAVALLAGDALLAEAITLALREQGGEPARVLSSVAELAGAAAPGGLRGGQHPGVAGHSRSQAGRPASAARTRDARLLVAAVESVLILTGESGPETDSLRRFAAEVGVLSQFVDDVVAATGGETHDATARSFDDRLREPSAESAPERQQTLERARQSHALASAALAQTATDTCTLERVADHVLACAATDPRTNAEGTDS